MKTFKNAGEKSHLAYLVCPKQIDWREANLKITMINKLKKRKNGKMYTQMEHLNTIVNL